MLASAGVTVILHCCPFLVVNSVVPVFVAFICAKLSLLSRVAAGCRRIFIMLVGLVVIDSCWLGFMFMGIAQMVP